MHVCLDTNVLFADLWFRSPRFEALRDFLEKTRSKLILPEVVEEELRAGAARRWHSAADKIHSAIAAARTSGLMDIDQYDAKSKLEATSARWEEIYRLKTARYAVRVPPDPDLLREVIRRCTYRIPPNTEKEEFRDTLIWLGLLGYCRANSISQVAFVSGNTRDFANGDGHLLPELVRDAQDHGVHVEYFTSIEAFLDRHALPLEWLNPEWVQGHIDESQLDRVITEALTHDGVFERELLAREGAFWEPDLSNVEWVSPTIDEVYVLTQSDTELQVLLSCWVQAEGILYAERALDPDAPDAGYTSAFFEVQIEREIDVTGRVRDNQVVDLEVDALKRAT